MIVDLDRAQSLQSRRVLFDRAAARDALVLGSTCTRSGASATSRRRPARPGSGSNAGASNCQHRAQRRRLAVAATTARARRRRATARGSVAAPGQSARSLATSVNGVRCSLEAFGCRCGRTLGAMSDAGAADESGTSSSLTIPRSSRLSYAATAWTGQRLHVRLPITGQAACDTGTAVELADVRRPVDGKPGTEIVCRGQLRLDGSSACRRWTAHGSAAMPERDRLPPLPVRRSRSAITAALRVSREPRASHRGPPWRRSGVAGVGPWRAVCLVSVRPGERPTGRMLSHVPSR